MCKKVVALMLCWMVVAGAMMVLVPQTTGADEAEGQLALDYSGGADTLEFPTITPDAEMVASTNYAILYLTADNGVEYNNISINFHNLFCQGKYLPTYGNLIVEWEILEGSAQVDTDTIELETSVLNVVGQEFAHPMEMHINVTIVKVPPSAIGNYSGIISVTGEGTRMVGGSPSGWVDELDGGQALLCVGSYPKLTVDFTGGYDSVSFQTDNSADPIESINYLKLQNGGNADFDSINVTVSVFTGDVDADTFENGDIIFMQYEYNWWSHEYEPTGFNYTTDANGSVSLPGLEDYEKVYYKIILPGGYTITQPQNYTADMDIVVSYEYHGDDYTKDYSYDDVFCVQINDTFMPYLVNTIVFNEIIPESETPTGLMEPLRISNSLSTVGIEAVEFYFTNFTNGEYDIPFYENSSVTARRGGLIYDSDAFEFNETVINNRTYNAKASLWVSGNFDEGQYMDFSFYISNVPVVPPGDYTAYYVAVVYAEGYGYAPAPSLVPQSVVPMPKVEILYGFVGDVETDVNVNLAFTDGSEVLHMDDTSDGAESNVMMLWNNEPYPITLLNIIYSPLISENGTADVTFYAVFNGHAFYPDSSGSIMIYDRGTALIDVAQTATIKFIVLNGLESNDTWEGSVQIMMQDSTSKSYALSPQTLYIGDFFNGFGDWSIEDLLQRPSADMGFDTSGVTPTKMHPEGTIWFDASASSDPGHESEANKGIELYIWWWGDLVTDVMDVDYPDSFEATTEPTISHDYSYNEVTPLLNTHPVTLVVLDDVGFANIADYLFSQGYGNFATAGALVEALAGAGGGTPTGGVMFAVMSFMSSHGLGADKQTGLLEVIEVPLAPTFTVSPSEINETGGVGEEVAITFYVTVNFDINIYTELALNIDVNVTESETQTIPFAVSIVAPNGNTIVNREEVDGLTATLGTLTVDDGTYIVTLFITLDEAGEYHSAYDISVVGTTFYGGEIESDEQAVTVDYTVESGGFVLGDYTWWIIGGIIIVVIVVALVMIYRRKSPDAEIRDATKQIQQNIRNGRYDGRNGMRDYDGDLPRKQVPPPYY